MKKSTILKNPCSRDLFSVINYAPLIPSTIDPPAAYEPGETFELDRDSTVNDICDFIVEYINSDVLVCKPFALSQPSTNGICKGLLSDRLLIIAGMLFFLQTNFNFDSLLDQSKVS